jgi:hypothetical protein
MRIIALFLFALALALAAGCAPAPALPPSPSAVPGAATTAPLNLWDWEREGADTPELATVLAGLETPEAIASWLQTNVEWRDDFDTRRFMAPASTVKERRTVCTGFARFWIRALARLGIKAEFLAVWSPEGAHAVAVARINGQFRLFSNQYYYGAPDQALGYDRDQAFAAAASEFYGQRWNTLEWWLTTGQRLDRTDVTRAIAPLAPLTPAAGRNLFTIKR